MSISINERQSGPVTLLTLNGRLVLGRGCDVLNEKVEHLIAEGRVRLLVECSQVSALDSRGISALVRGLIKSRKRGGDLKLLKPSTEVCRVLKLVRLLGVIESFDDEAQRSQVFRYCELAVASSIVGPCRSLLPKNRPM